MSLADAFDKAIGPYGALFLTLVAAVYIWRLWVEQRRETKAMERDRDHWRDLYYLSVVSGERAVSAAAALATLPPVPTESPA